ncbi:norbelladine synthase-like [Rhodamnia argentea]|uniref:Norbelladine synthase-like n=1 Tax=Rhodamnia argentea TaxID=178133 RepID=A0A8B8PDG8_9MYRT|nr:norbelladine synthase-like [Rhodamnia argentea]XP_048127858.1 norbelladine synthase-like [Rhodamnia argentea]XP_048127859.1 norbelladine synthase-like [Rhodamnia argentea]XP_048127860.1 norbelladine synthase-like [Rhodamnia argentea]
MFGQLSHETQVKVGAGKAWELYGTINLALLAKEELSHTILQLDILEGDGGVGTTIKLTFAGGFSYKEKFTKVDNERRVKETEAVEGGFLDMGLSLYRVRFEVVGGDEEESCVIKSTVEYEVADGASFDVSIISVKPFADLAEAAKKQLTTSAGAD